MALTWMKTRPRTEIEIAFRLCRASLLMVFALSFFLNLLALTVPLYLLQVYDHVLSSHSIDTLAMLTVIAVVALAVSATLDGLRRQILSQIGTWLDDRIQAAVLTSAVQAALRSDPSAAAQAWRDLNGLRTFFAGNACNALFDLPWTPIFVLAMIVVHPLLGILGLVAMVILFGLALLNEALTRQSVARASAAWSNSQHRFEALLRNVEAISAMGMLPGVARILHDEQSEAKEAQLSAGIRGAMIQSVARFVRLLTQITVMAFAAWLVIRHDISPAAIFVSSILLGRSLGPVEGAIGTWKAVTSARLGYFRLQRLMSAAPPKAPGMWLPRPRGELAVEQVTYTPPGSDTSALRRLSFNLGAGEVLGIVGPSGAGKSTLGRLIAGIILPTAGHVRLDGADMAIWMASGGHGHFGYLPQDVELFGGTVRDNIARLQDTSSDDVIAAASLVGLHETIMRLPQGYDTDIGEGGARLSGGQRQRLGLARAFFGDPRLVVLDEPNASLDQDGEEALRQAILEMRDRGTTVVVIAQRLGILGISDKVLILENGALNAFGSRRDVAEKIRSGRTAIKVKGSQMIDGRRKQVQDPGAEPSMPSASNGTMLVGDAKRAAS